jgi:hypothetical protein
MVLVLVFGNDANDELHASCNSIKQGRRNIPLADQDGVEDNSDHLAAQSSKVLTPQATLRTPEKKPFRGPWPRGLLERRPKAGPPASRPDPDPDPDQSIKNDLARVSEAYRHYQSRRARDAVYVLLDQVYVIGLRWKRERCAKKNSRLMLKLQDDPIDMKPEPFAVLLYCGGVEDPKARSKFSRVLRVAEAHEASSIQDFAQKRGGINQVAAMFF